MDKWIHPAFFFLIGSLLLPFVKGKAKKCFTLLIPILSIIDVALMKVGTYGSVNFLGMNLVFGRVDKLSLVFAWVFVIMAFLGALYALHVKEDGHHIAGSYYIGASLGATFRGRLSDALYLLGNYGLFFGIPCLVPQRTTFHRCRLSLSPRSRFRRTSLLYRYDALLCQNRQSCL